MSRATVNQHTVSPGQIADRVKGALLMHTAGDAFGSRFEFIRDASRIEDMEQNREILANGRWLRGEGTDDSDLTAAVWRAYGTAGGFSLEEIARNTVAWGDGPKKDIGATTSAGIGRLRQLLASGGDLTTAGPSGERDAGNGSLMRIAPVGLIERDPYERMERARTVSSLTHGNVLARESCAIYSNLLGHLVEGDDPDRAYIRAKEEYEADFLAKGGVQPDDAVNPVLDAFEKGWHTALEHAGDPDGGVGELGSRGFVLHGLALSTWALRRAADVGPEEALIAVAHLGNDADTNAAIAGAVLGAHYGTAAVPERWREAVMYGPEIEEIAPALSDQRIAAMRAAGDPRLDEFFDPCEHLVNHSTMPATSVANAGAELPTAEVRVGPLGRLLAKVGLGRKGRGAGESSRVRPCGAELPRGGRCTHTVDEANAVDGLVTCSAQHKTVTGRR